MNGFGITDEELELIRKIVREPILKYGDDIGPQLERIRNGEMWNDHIAVQAGIAILKELKYKQQSVSVAGTSSNNLFALFDKAKETLKYPKLTYVFNDGIYPDKIQLSLAGAKASKPGSINITDGGPYGRNVWFGRINRGAEAPAIQSNFRNTALADKIYKIMEDPQGMAKLQGQKFAHCCFCGLELTNKNSVTVGYGPVCAENWGLPWEGTADAAELEREKELIANLGEL
jgi:hypothetical protein